MSAGEASASDPNRSAVAAALICGGRSRRMAAAGDKGLIRWPPPEGPRLVSVQLDKLARIVGSPSRVMVSCQTDQAQLYSGDLRFVFDRGADLGPLGGIAACLREAADEGAQYLLVLAIDLPLMTISFLEQLVDRAQSEGLGIVSRRGDHWEPMAAVYPTRISDEAERRLQEGELAMQAFVDWGVENGHLIPKPIDEPQAGLFHNLNTPEDLASAAAMLGSAGFEIARHSHSAEWQPEHIIDEVAAEEPLELRVEGRSVAVVMRTPGHDEELAAGFLVTEGVARRREDFFEISKCRSIESGDGDIEARGNVIDVLLGGEAKTRDLDHLTRHVFTSSSCGVCGKATLESVFQTCPPLAAPEQRGEPRLSRDLLIDLPNRLRLAQRNFRRTGGLHASALFDAPSGELRLVREDVGRHNALDKVIGHALLHDRLPLSSTVLLLSGRISFELMQKAHAAGIPIVAGISAPSSLAVRFARESGQTLIGFLRESTFNVYAGGERLCDGPGRPTSGGQP